MTNPLIKSYEASAVVLARRIVAFSDVAASAKVAQAATPIAPAFGISSVLDTPVGAMCDVTLSGLAQLVLGGTVTAGAPIMSDANGAGVTAVAAAGATRRIVAIALEPGVVGDIIWVNVAPSLLDRA